MWLEIGVCVVFMCDVGIKIIEAFHARSLIYFGIIVCRSLIIFANSVKLDVNSSIVCDVERLWLRLHFVE